MCIVEAKMTPYLLVRIVCGCRRGQRCSNKWQELDKDMYVSLWQFLRRLLRCGLRQRKRR
jgi:hypothetical protein